MRSRLPRKSKVASVALRRSPSPNTTRQCCIRKRLYQTLRNSSGSFATLAAMRRLVLDVDTGAALSVTTKRLGVLIAVGLAVAARRLRFCRRIRASVSPFLFRETFVARLYSFRSVGL